MKKLFICVLLAVIMLIVNVEKTEDSCFVESISNDSEIEQDYLATIEFNYEPYIYNKIESSTLSVMQSNLEKNRKESKEYYSKNNKYILNELGLDTLDFYISEYSPFAYKFYDKYEEYEEEKLNLEKIANSEHVEYVYVTSEITSEEEIETTISSSASSRNISLEMAKSICSVSNVYSDGSGVKVGVIDAYNFGTTFANFSDQIVQTGGRCNSTSASHCKQVSTIIAGDDGVAPGAQLYIYGCDMSANYSGSYSLFSAMDWMLDNGVSVVNISMYRPNDLYGVYDTTCAFLDYCISNHYVNVVKSAGNTGGYITCPGMGLNVITVGSINAEGNVSYFSSYQEQSSYSHILKPTLVAPGENIVVPSYSSALDGTSYSAPMVAGIIALLLKEFPSLIYYPDTIMSTLISSAQKLSSQTSCLDNIAGAGLVCYSRARLILSGSNYRQYVVTEECESDATIGAFSITIPANSSVKISFANIIWKNRTNTITDSAYIPSVTKYCLKVYDSNWNYIETILSNNSNINKCEYLNNSSNNVTYRFELCINGENRDSYDQAISISFY